ncbi:amylo-alpha-1,6-glucosidase [Microbacterium aurum]
MTDRPTPATLAALTGRHLDLVRAPFTLPSSRLIVFREGDGVRVHTSEYERRLAECRVLDSLTVRDASSRPIAITAVLPDRVVFGDGAATLVFAGPAALSLGASAPGFSAQWTTPDGETRTAPLAPAVRFDVAEDRSVRAEASLTHEADAGAARALWREWFAACPVVRDDLQEMTAFCWWVLGANIVSLPRLRAQLGDVRAVVPSKIGYVGLWQWDAYFIATGLRHGAPDLAREQLDLAFGFPSPNGQLPDVVHEEGVLATSDDLPQADRDRLRRAGSQIADPHAPVPLTKPPLAAWALRKVLEALPRTPDNHAWARRHLETIRGSQDWWFACSDLDGDGMPEYGHPYSSGLDDSPIFDGPLPTTAPDLGAYLVLQDLELARFAEEYGDADPDMHRERAQRTLAKLLELWVPTPPPDATGASPGASGRVGPASAGVFRARAAGEPVASDAIVGLMPLLTGSLPSDITEALVAALDDPARYGTPWGLPTVAAGDPDFSPERMWRGPVWVNTNLLVAEGLEASGRPDLARELAERTVALVIHGGGPHEYFNPLTGEKAETATTAFGWSAALFVDLAVRLSA